SDIWSIGVCLYELLTTRVPFDAPGLAEICAMVLKDPVVPPSRYNPNIPPDLEAVILKCLAKDAGARFQTVAELAFALEPWSQAEGSARRILHVMQTVQKTELPTLVNVPADLGAMAAQTQGDGPKTVDGWDSGDMRTRRTSKVTPVVAVLGAFGAFALVGIVLIGVTLARGTGPKTSASAGATAAADDSSEASAAPPQPVPVPMPTQEPASTAATTAATPAPAPVPTTTVAAGAAPRPAPPAPPPATPPKKPPPAAAPPPPGPKPPPSPPAKPPPTKGVPGGADRF
ncbi:MAG: hypothetical protein JST00_48255, partial [Deltaproteobacteria bacterium]|nr:hypothetical protein [Deltaproteobacteria bacterium]